jgi:hypothetical protein
MKSLSELYDEQTFVTVYGEPYISAKDSPFALTAADGTNLTLVEVVGLKALGICEKISLPTRIFLPGEGRAVDDNDCGWKKPILKWSLGPSYRTSALALYSDSLTNLVKGPFNTRDVSGGATVGNWRFQGGSICCTVHVWAKADVCLPIVGCHTILDMNETRDVCVSLGQCVTIIDIGIANAQICYYPPKQVCVDVNVNVGPYHQRVVHQCLDIPIPPVAPSLDPDCGCKKIS